MEKTPKIFQFSFREITLLCVGISLTILFLLAYFIIPKFNRTVESTRLKFLNIGISTKKELFRPLNQEGLLTLKDLVQSFVLINADTNNNKIEHINFLKELENSIKNIRLVLLDISGNAANKNAIGLAYLNMPFTYIADNSPKILQNEI